MRKLFLTLAILMLTASATYAGCVDTYGIGSKAAALGGAYSAYADDPYAAYYNPAGLTQIDRAVLSGGANMMNVKIELDNFRVSNTNDSQIRGPNDFSDDTPTLFAPHLGFAMPVSNWCSLGVAVYAPWGLKPEWEKDPEKNPGAYNYFSSYYLREVVTPTAAFKISDKLSLGLGISVGKSLAGEERRAYISPDLGRDPVLGPMLSDAATQQAAAGFAAVETLNPGIVPTIETSTAAYNFLNSVANNPTTDPAAAQEAAANAAKFRGYADAGMETAEQIGAAQAAQLNGVPAVDHGAHIEAEIEDSLNYSFNLGVMYKPMDTLTLGLTYRSRTDADFEGDIKKNGKMVSTNVTMDYDHPEQIQFGVRYVPASNQDISIELDMVWTNWSINENQDVAIDLPMTLHVIPGNPIADRTISESNHRRDWEDTKQVRVGVEWKATEIVTLRGGYFYDPSPIPDDTMDLMWPDADKKSYSLGCGLNFGNFTVDSVFQYVDIEKARYLGGESDNFNHSYTGTGTHKEVSSSADGYLWGLGLTLSYKF